MLSTHIRRAGQLGKRHSPLFLTVSGVAGVIATSYLAAKGAWQARGIIDEEPDDITFEEQFKLTWKCYIPAGIAGAGTVAAISLGSRLQGKRTAAAVSAYSLTETAFREYRERVVDEIGKHKEQVIRDDLAREKIEGNPPKSADSMVIGTGEVLCCELYTRRYFNSTMEKLRKAQNDMNALIISDLYVTLDQFYDKLGLPYTSHSGELGWDADRMLELEFSTVLTEDGRPCLAFEYNYIKPI